MQVLMFFPLLLISIIIHEVTFCQDESTQDYCIQKLHSEGTWNYSSLCQPWSGHDSSLCLWSNIDRLEPVSTCTHLVVLASVKTKLPQMVASLIDLQDVRFLTLRNFRLHFLFTKFHSAFIFCEKNIHSYIASLEIFQRLVPENYLKFIGDTVLLF